MISRAFAVPESACYTAFRPDKRNHLSMRPTHTPQDSAADAGQKYKEGKFILERCAVTLEGCDGDGYSDGFSGRPSSRTDNRYGYGYGPEYGSDGCGSRSGGGFVAWGADHAPTASGGHW